MFDKGKYDMQKEIDSKIENNDIEEINEILDNIKCDVEIIDISEKIIRKGEKNMKKKRIIKIMIIAAAIAAVNCIIVSGAYIYNNYIIEKEGRLYTVETDRELSGEEIDEIVKEIEDIDNNEKVNTVTEYDIFENIEEAEEKYDIKIILPDVMPELEINEITGHERYDENGEFNGIVWLDYGNADEKAFCITIEKKGMKEGDINVSVNDIDDGTLKEYDSKKGYIMREYEESNEDKTKTAKIVCIDNGKYEYDFCFIGFKGNEIKEIIDSIDYDEFMHL